MKQKIVMTGLCLFALLSAGWVLRATRQQQKKINTTPAPPLRVEPAKESDATGKTVAAAKAFLATLDDAGRAKVSFAFNSDQKSKWSNFPVGIYKRNGLRWGDLSAAQREAALKLLATALSKQGLQKVKEIMEGDEVLKTSESGRDGGPRGGPPPGGPPNDPPGGRGSGQAILPFQVSDLVLGAGEDGKTIQPEGIKVSALNAAQKDKLLDVVYEWVGILNDEAAAAKMAEIKANLPETWFAWSGPTTNGSAAYYRIQGPTLLIEYSPQRMRGSSGLDTTHIHTIYRDPTNDYGARLVRR
jgi:Protein of unknown function (DUF3500)